MNLFFVTFHYGDITNGPGRFADYFVRYIETRCPSIALTVVSADSGISKYGERVVHMERSPRRGSTLFTTRKIYRYLWGEVEKGGVDAIYYNSPNNAIFLPDGTNLYMNFNDYYNAEFRLRRFLKYRPYEALYKCLWRTIERRHCRKVNRLFANSQYTKDAIVAAYRIDPRTVVVSHKAVDPGLFRRGGGRSESRTVRISFIGTDYKRKGLANAVRVVRNLVKTYQLECELAIIGCYRPKEIDDIRALILRNEISEQARISSENVDIGDHLAQTDFLLLPAEQEAFGVVLLEALASGVVVIASDVGGIPEIISHGKDGFLFENSDVDGMAEMIYHLSRNDAARRDIIRNGTEKAGLFSVERVSERILSEMMHDSR